MSEISFLKLGFNTALAFGSVFTSDKLYGILNIAVERGAGTNYRGMEVRIGARIFCVCIYCY